MQIYNYSSDNSAFNPHFLSPYTQLYFARRKTYILCLYIESTSHEGLTMRLPSLPNLFAKYNLLLSAHSARYLCTPHTCRKAEANTSWSGHPRAVLSPQDQQDATIAGLYLFIYFVRFSTFGKKGWSRVAARVRHHVDADYVRVPKTVASISYARILYRCVQPTGDGAKVYIRGPPSYVEHLYMMLQQANELCVVHILVHIVYIARVAENRSRHQ